MGTEKLVDADFIARLTQGSYETAVASVDEAVMEHAKLFGDSGESLTTLATFSEHLIVASEGGNFYRAKWSIEEDGSIVISDVEDIDVPVYEAGAMAVQVREEANRIVGLVMEGKVEEAGAEIGGLYKLVKSGVRLTAEGVEDLYQKQDFSEDDWFKATREQEKAMRGFLGVEAMRIEVPQPRFESLLGEGVDDQAAEMQRGAVRAALAKLRDRFAAMRQQLTLAREVNEGYQPRDGGDATSVADFVDFVQGLDEALDTVSTILSDAVIVAEDGCVKCLARVHDGLASQAYEWALAAAFSEKLARRFEPVAA